MVKSAKHILAQLLVVGLVIYSLVFLLASRNDNSIIVKDLARQTTRFNLDKLLASKLSLLTLKTSAPRNTSAALSRPISKNNNNGQHHNNDLSNNNNERSDFSLLKQKDLKFLPAKIIDYVYSKIEPSSINWDSYAYVTYATDVNHLCSAVMNFHNLRKVHRSKAKLVLIYDQSWDKLEIQSDEELNQHKKDHGNTDRISVVDLLLTAVNDYNVQLLPVDLELDSFKDIKLRPEVWDANYIKALLFNQTQFDRIVYFDCNSVLQHNLDELFFIPPSHVALPEAYWLARENYKHIDFARSKYYKNFLSKDLNKDIQLNEGAKIARVDLVLRDFEVRKTLNINNFYSKIYNALPNYHFKNNLHFLWSTHLAVIKPSSSLFDEVFQKLIEINHNQDLVADAKRLDIINEFFSLNNVLINEHADDADLLLQARQTVLDTRYIAEYNKHKSYLNDKDVAESAGASHSNRTVDYRLPNAGNAIASTQDEDEGKSLDAVSKDAGHAEKNKRTLFIWKKIPQAMILPHQRYSLITEEFTQLDHSHDLSDSTDLPFLHSFKELHFNVNNKDRRSSQGEPSSAAAAAAEDGALAVAPAKDSIAANAVSAVSEIFSPAPAYYWNSDLFHSQEILPGPRSQHQRQSQSQSSSPAVKLIHFSEPQLQTTEEEQKAKKEKLKSTKGKNAEEDGLKQLAKPWSQKTHDSINTRVDSCFNELKELSDDKRKYEVKLTRCKALSDWRKIYQKYATLRLQVCHLPLV